MKIPKLLQATILGSLISLGAQAKAQEQETKPLPNYSNYPNYFRDFNLGVPKDNPLSWENQWTPSPYNPDYFKDLNFQMPSSNRSKSKKDNGRMEGFLLGVGFSALIFIPTLLILRLKKFIQQQGKEFEEFLSENENSLGTRKQSAQEKEIRATIFKILKQRGGIDPSIYK